MLIGELDNEHDPFYSGLPERFWNKVEIHENGTCWEWVAGKSSAGYGRYKINGKFHSPYRVLYEIVREEIPDKFVIDHLCRVPACVNPWHLEPVTNRENTLRGVGLTAQNAKKNALS